MKLLNNKYEILKVLGDKGKLNVVKIYEVENNKIVTLYEKNNCIFKLMI